METYHGDHRAAVKLHELGLKRFPDEDRVWDSYLELEKRRPGGNVEGLLTRRRAIQGDVKSSRAASSTTENVWSYEWGDDADLASIVAA